MKSFIWPDPVFLTLNPSYSEAEVGGGVFKFQAILGTLGRPGFKINNREELGSSATMKCLPGVWKRVQHAELRGRGPHDRSL